MKRFPAIVLLTVLLANAAGFYVYYIVELHRIHLAMKRELLNTPADQLSRFAMTTDQYQDALVEENEIKVDGKMYDVSQTKVEGDSVIVFALHDVREDNLALFINEVIAKPMTHDSGIVSFVINYTSLLYLPAAERDSTTTFVGSIIAHYSTYNFVGMSASQSQCFHPPRQ